MPKVHAAPLAFKKKELAKILCVVMVISATDDFKVYFAAYLKVSSPPFFRPFTTTYSPALVAIIVVIAVAPPDPSTLTLPPVKVLSPLIIFASSDLKPEKIISLM